MPTVHRFFKCEKCGQQFVLRTLFGVLQPKIWEVGARLEEGEGGVTMDIADEAVLVSFLVVRTNYLAVVFH
eukprot:9377389-Ditylum_brightwellii.AAC.1